MIWATLTLEALGAHPLCPLQLLVVPRLWAHCSSLCLTWALLFCLLSSSFMRAFVVRFWYHLIEDDLALRSITYLHLQRLFLSKVIEDAEWGWLCFLLLIF